TRGEPGTISPEIRSQMLAQGRERPQTAGKIRESVATVHVYTRFALRSAVAAQIREVGKNFLGRDGFVFFPFHHAAQHTHRQDRLLPRRRGSEVRLAADGLVKLRKVVLPSIAYCLCEAFSLAHRQQT